MGAYRGGLVASVDLDLNHRGRAERRLVYGLDGTLDHLEADPDGDGNFKVLSVKADDERETPRAAKSGSRKGGR